MAENDRSEEDRHRDEVFVKAINRHGFGFQYAVLNQAERCFRSNESEWFLEASEFPVAVRDSNTHIDFILRSASMDKFTASAKEPIHVFLICECKRANPALRQWCFFRSPYPRRRAAGGVPEYLFVDVLMIGGPLSFTSTGCRLMDMTDHAYHHAIEIKGHAKGDECGTGRGAVDQAVSQVLRGTNGLIEYLSAHRDSVPTSNYVLIPVIFTTALLFASDVDLADATLEGGEIEIAQLVQKPWIVLQHHVSPTIRHTLNQRIPSADEIGRVLESEFARSVIVVSAAATPQFFREFRTGGCDFAPIRPLR